LKDAIHFAVRQPVFNREVLEFEILFLGRKIKMNRPKNVE